MVVHGTIQNVRGWSTTIEITGFESQGKQWHICGDGRVFRGVSYDYWQMWCPMSISMIIFNHIGGSGGKDKNRVCLPNWFLRKVKVYHMSEDKLHEMSLKCRKETEWSDYS